MSLSNVVVFISTISPPLSLRIDVILGLLRNETRDWYSSLGIFCFGRVAPGMNLSGVASQFAMQNRSFAMRN